MKYYLASRYGRRLEMCAYRAQLRANGHEVTRRWLNGDHQIADVVPSEADKEREANRFASEDMQDVARADCVISFTEPPRSPHSRGCRHVEFGIALALDKSCVVIGPKENVFHHLYHVACFRTWVEFAGYHKMKAFTPVVTNAEESGL